MTTHPGLPTERHARSDVLDAVSDTLTALDRLQRAERNGNPGHAPLSDRLHADLMGWIDAHLDDLWPVEAWRLCATALPTSVLEQTILHPDGGTATRLYEKAKPCLERFVGVGIHPEAHVPEVIQHLSSEAIARMIEDGMRLVGNATAVEAARLWLTKGEAIGKPAWRKHFPRKNPALAYWERYGFALPPTLHPDGADTIVDALMNCMHQAKFNAYNAWRSQSNGDSRLGLALLLLHDGDPFEGSRRVENWFPEAWHEWVHTWTAPTDHLTGHQRLQRRYWADHAPQARDVLLWDRLPDTPSDAMVERSAHAARTPNV
jgi:hypothetical protein